jgi:hypothetical protein
VSAPIFSIDVLRSGLRSLLQGPVQDESHPLHDPVIWLTEATCWVFDDSGLTAVLESPAAAELLGRRLHDDLLELDRVLREAHHVIAQNVADARAQITAPVNAVVADLDAAALPASRNFGAD